MPWLLTVTESLSWAVWLTQAHPTTRHSYMCLTLVRAMIYLSLAMLTILIEYIKYPDSNPRAPNGSVIRKSTSGLTSRQRSLRQMHTGTPTSVASPPQGSVLNGRPLSPELGEISSEPGQRAASPVPTAALGSTRSNIHPTNPEVVPHQSDNTETAVPTTLEDVLEGYPHLVADNHCLLLGQADDIDVHLVAWIHHAFVVVMQAKLLGTALDEHRMAIVLDVIQAVRGLYFVHSPFLM
jgi:hypothetical protein